MIERCLTAAAALIVLAAYAYAAGQKPPVLRPIFQTDLRALGWEPPRKLREGLYYPAPRSPIFLSDGALAVSLFVANPHPGLSIRGKKFGGPELFETFFFDTHSWSVARNSVWSNAGVSIGFFPGPDGSFAVWDNFELNEHAADGRTLATLALDPHTLPRFYHVFASASGATLFVERDRIGGTSLELLRARDLKSLGSVDVHPCFEYAASDSYLACLREPFGSSGLELYVSPIDPQNLADLHFQHVFTAGQCSSISFLREDMIASGGCDDLTVLKPSGDLIFHHGFGIHADPILSYRTCRWLVAVLSTGTFGNELLRSPPKTFVKRIVVADLQTGRLADIPHKMTLQLPDSGAALSPDGCLLAEQIDWRLQVYDLCHSSFADALGLQPR